MILQCAAGEGTRVSHGAFPPAATRRGSRGWRGVSAPDGCVGLTLQAMYVFLCVVLFAVILTENQNRQLF